MNRQQLRRLGTVTLTAALVVGLSPFVASVAEFLYKITEPVLRPIRNVMPNLGGLDISPIIVILIIMFIERVITYYIYPNVI